MEENFKQPIKSSKDTNPGLSSENDKSEISEDDLEQISGGTDDKQNKTFGVQKDKQASAAKNAAAVKALL